MSREVERLNEISEKYSKDVFEEPCPHPFIKGRKCLVCDEVLSKALVESRDYRPAVAIEEEE